MGEIYGTPRVPRDYVSRPHLTAKLDTDSPLVVVRGPAGSGKTVAVADWATASGSAHPFSGAWYPVDSASTTRLAFWNSLIQTMLDARLLPDTGLLARSVDSLGSEPDLTRLLRRGFAQIEQHTALVIDDFHLITDDAVHRDLVALLVAQPRLRATVVTRTWGPLESDSVRLALAPVVITPNELPLSVEETAEALASAGIHDDDGTIARAVWETVGGSTVLTRGVLLAMARGEIGFSIASLNESIATVSGRILRSQLPTSARDVRQLNSILRCSIAEFLTVDLAERLTARDDAAELLAQAERDGFGMWAERPGGPQFTFTPAVRAGLLAELTQRFPRDVKRLNQVTAEWMLGNGRELLALRHAIAADDMELASRVAVNDWFSLLELHRALLIEMVGALPLRTLQRAPLLTMVLALAYNASQVHRVKALEMFGLAIVSAKLRGPKEPLANRLVLLTIESVAFRVMGQIGQAVSAAERARALLDELSVDERDELAAHMSTLTSMLGLSFFYGGQPERAQKLFETAAVPQGRTGGAWYHGLALHAGGLALTGDIPEAQALLTLADEVEWPEGWRDGYIGAWGHIADGMIALESFDAVKAQHHVTVMEPHLATIEHWSLFAQVQAMVFLITGRAHEGIAYLRSETKRHSASLNPHTNMRLDRSRALLYFAAGREGEAEALLRKHPKSAPGVAVNWARLALLANQPERAIRALDEVAPATPMSSRLQSEALLLRASAALRLGRDEFAFTALDEAAGLMLDRRLNFALLLLPRSDVEALAALAAAHGHTSAVALLAQVDGHPPVFGELRPAIELTERERVVLQQLVTTGNHAEIAAALFVSPNTVKSQLRALYRKLGVTSRTEALLTASERHLISS
ncbi:LuxR C-terminal-related transcriptional regulator [Leifsonia kafniensis]|uniref:LuxR C-terminal-related transcriptional regulator n=1 Tax=Leifsonia kafniensis TaxID=475957 RepID=UPI0031F0577E